MVSARFCEALQNLTELVSRNDLPQVLVIGPGTTDPIECITTTLTPTRLVLIELDLQAVKWLHQHWSESGIKIVHGDAAALTSLAPGPYDLVIVRHPNIERFPERWTAVFSAVKLNLREDGLLLLSAYSLAEVSALKTCLAKVGIDLEYSPQLTNQPLDLQGNDHYLLLGRIQ